MFTRPGARASSVRRASKTGFRRSPKYRKRMGHRRSGMLPGHQHADAARTSAESRGRTQEIQRLIGRSLRSVTNLPALGERTIWIDCDVIQADEGRMASITAPSWPPGARGTPQTRRHQEHPAFGLCRGHQRRYRRRRGAARSASTTTRAPKSIWHRQNGDGRFIEVGRRLDRSPREARRAARPPTSDPQLIEKQRAIVGNLIVARDCGTRAAARTPARDD